MEKHGIKMKGTFFHIAKTAGTSQIHILKKYNYITISNLYFNNTETMSSDINNQFKWTIVRNPFERLISVMAAWEWKHVNRTLTQLLDLVELGYLIDWKIPNSTPEIEKLDLWQNTDMAILTHLKPMYTIIDNINSKNIKIDFIGRYEYLNISWKYIKKKLKIYEDLPKLNYSNHKLYRSYFTRKKFLDRTIELYKKDFEYFNYSTQI